jgi:outer membrane protein
MHNGRSQARLGRHVAHVILAVVILPFVVIGQTFPAADSISGNATLDECVKYAMTHQPTVKKSLIEEKITERSISSKLADWYPQLSFGFYVQHDPQLPYSFVEGSTPIRVGLPDASAGEFTLSQTIFDRDVLLASSTASDVRRQMEQQTASNKIDVGINVSKAFYAVLVTQQEIGVLNEDILRLERSLKDAYDQYVGGIVDKIDYKRATIALNSARAEKKESEELLKARYVALKEAMGYPASLELKLISNTAEMEREALIDTNQTLRYDRRIEYQLLQTEKRLQVANLHYNVWGFLPSLTLYGNYSFTYENDMFPHIYDQRYPSSYVGLQLSFPIFEGGKRIDEIRQAQLEVDEFDYEFASLKNSINTEYADALAAYKSELNTYNVLKENLQLAREVYETVELQYKAGTKTYLEVITAESDLRTAEINRTSALYEVLSSKLDVERALGLLHY